MQGLQIDRAGDDGVLLLADRPQPIVIGSLWSLHLEASETSTHSIVDY
jgi:hypothetical protein